MPQVPDCHPSTASWLISTAICCALAGCSGSSTTLSIDSPIATHPETASHKDVASSEHPADQAEKLPPADATAPVVENSEPAAQPSEVPSDTATKLQPKLTMVDPARIVGSWRDSFFGTRTLTLNADGTAHMRLDLDFGGRLLYGSHLDFDMKWKLESGVVTIDIIGGHPAKTANSAIETWGKRYVYLLDHVEDNKVEMRDGVQATSYTLARLPDDATSPTSE